jgi:glycosyltransferase involved in cell wall biosynthesis
MRRQFAASARKGVRRLRIELDWLRSRRGAVDLALFHEFATPPTGGGHQFLRAFLRELAGRGAEVELNRLSSGTRACLVNSFNFDFGRLRRFAREDCHVVHRVDGPVGVYRGFDDGTDARLVEFNRQLANATILQSQYSLEKHLEIGYDLRDPVVIPNAVDPGIFYPPLEREPLAPRRVRLIASSWSDNVRKGAQTLAWLDANLDQERYEMTFVGRAPHRFRQIRAVGPVGSDEVAELLRAHDVYLAASRDDPCSNALLEALACGLPAAFIASGGHPELVGDGGLPFYDEEELPGLLDRLVDEIEERRAAISIPSISEVADRYLDVLLASGVSLTAVREPTQDRGQFEA